MKSVIDVHLHSTQNNSVEDSIAIFKKIYKWTGMENALFLGLPQDSKGNTDYLQNLKTIFYKQYFDAYAFAGLIHDTSLSDSDTEKYFLKQAEEAKIAGFDGVKMLDGKPSMRKIYKRLLSDPVYDKFYSFMEENAFPITLHNADPAYMWDMSKMSPYAIEHGWYCGDLGMSKDEMFDDVMRVMEKHPKLHLTLAHLGFTGENIEQAKRFLGDYEYTMFDTTPGVQNFHDMLPVWDSWYAFIVQYQDRIKYGADTYNFVAKDEEELKVLSTRRPYQQRRFFEGNEPFDAGETKLCGVHLDDYLLEKIYRTNALREYGTPKAINTAFVREWLDSAKASYKDDQKAMRDLLFIEENFVF